MPASAKSTAKEEPEEAAAPATLSEALDMLPGSVMQREANEAATKEAEKAAKEAEKEAAKAAKKAETDADESEFEPLDEPTEVSSTDER